MKILKMKFFGITVFALILAAAISCSNGGKQTISWPDIPEGTLYLNAEGMPENLGGRYAEITETFNQTVPLPANPFGGQIWPHGLYLWATCYNEKGFILSIEPDNPADDMMRMSVALHPRGINFTSSTLDFIAEDPSNLFLVLNIMQALEGEQAGGLTGGGTLESDIFITAGGHYKSKMKEGAQEMVDNYYENLPVYLRLLVTKEQFKNYISQLLYDSTYEGGERISLTEFFNMFLDPWNWHSMDFKVTIERTVALSGIMREIEVQSLKEYKTGNVEWNARIYAGEEQPLEDYRLRPDFPVETGGRQMIRTHMADAGSQDEDFIQFLLLEPARIYIAVDPENLLLINLLENRDWAKMEEKTIKASLPSNTETIVFNLYFKDYIEGPFPERIVLPGNSNPETNMYFVLADAGEYPSGIEIIVTAHTTEIKNNPDYVSFHLPGIKEEGGIVVNEKGIIEGGDIKTGIDLVHADFIREFDANVFVNTGGGRYGLQNSINDVSDIQFIEHILSNNGFRLIDTYNDMYPAFGGESQVLLIENMFGFPLDNPVRVELLKEELYSFTNMNLLNSPNLIGLYVKMANTDSGIEIWRNEEGDRSLNFREIIDFIEGNEESGDYTYIICKTEEKVSLQELLKIIGKSQEGELTFCVKAEFPENKTFHFTAGAFNHDYFTNIYDPAIGMSVPMRTLTGEREDR